jgi:predicted phosphodiesterase
MPHASRTPYRLAFLTDIHANVHALAAVLADLRRQAPDLVVVGGDLTFRFRYPRETLELLATVEHLAVAGNTERYVAAWSVPGAWPAFLPAYGATHAAWTRAEIGEEWTAHLAALPPQLALSLAGSNDGDGEVLVVHGVPGNAFVGIHAPPGPANRHPQWAMPDEALAGHLDGVRAPLILAGHTHVPLLRRWRDSLIVNPGAVGYTWPGVPEPHLARYALLTRHPGRDWEVDFRAVPYDNAAALRGLAELESHSPTAAHFAVLIRSAEC